MTETLAKEEKQNQRAPEGVDVADGRSPAPGEEESKKTEPRQQESAETQDAKADTTPEEASTASEAGAAQEKSKNMAKEKEEELTPLEKAQKESAEYKDAWQRERADFANYRKRMIHEKAQLREGAITTVIHDLLEPLDNLGRVLSSKSENAEVANFIEGVRMIQNQFLGVLEKYNVKTVNPKDETFDPFVMEAIATEEREDLGSEVVLEVYQVGYVQEASTGKHVIRPARVKVGRPKETASREGQKDTPEKPHGQEPSQQNSHANSKEEETKD